MFLLLVSGYYDHLRRHHIYPYDTLAELYGSEKGMNPHLVGTRLVGTIQELLEEDGEQDLRCLIVKYEISLPTDPR